jgi:adenosylmethionine-8-amino-7-oxononanoate aminotransferase
MIGLELVADRASKRPFERGTAMHKRIQQAALADNLIVFPGPGTADGLAGDHVLLAPPYICTDVQIDEIAETMARVVATATQDALAA